MIPTIITTNHPAKAVRKIFGIDITTPHPDVFITNPESKIGIEDVRDMQQFIYTKPGQLTRKYIIIPESQNITTIAQQGLLKSLEESPDYLQFILCTPAIHTLLPTIVSRSWVTTYQDQDPAEPIDEKYFNLSQNLPQASISQKIELAQNNAKNRLDAAKTIQQLTLIYRNKLLTEPSSTTVQTLKTLHSAHKHLNQNANPQLTLEHLFFTSPWKN